MSQWVAFAISLASEALTAALLALALWRQARLSGLAALSAVVGTCLTHPIVWPAALFLYPQIGYWLGLIAVEAFAFFGEWPVYRLLTRLSWQWSLVLSFAANSVSLSLGLILPLLR
jgi:hypothetical protein